VFIFYKRAGAQCKNHFLFEISNLQSYKTYFDTQKSNNDTFNCNFNTDKNDFYTQSVISNQRVILTRTYVITLFKGPADSEGCSKDSFVGIWNQGGLLCWWLKNKMGMKFKWCGSHHMWGKGQRTGWSVGGWCCGKWHRLACTCSSFWFCSFV
jgi:hypothetical protein